MESPFILVIVVGLALLLFMNWRTRKKQQASLSFRDTLEPGQEVQTIGGLIGTVTDVTGDRITLETAPGTEVVFVKAALAKLIEDPAEEVEDDVEDTDVDGAEDEDLESAEADAAVDTQTGEDDLTDTDAVVVQSPDVPDEELTTAGSPEAEDDSPRTN